MVLVEAPDGWTPEPASNQEAVKNPAKTAASASRKTTSEQKIHARNRPKPQHPEDLQETMPSVGTAAWGEDLKLEEPVERPPTSPSFGNAAKFESLDISAQPQPSKTASNAKKPSPADGPLIPKDWVSDRTRRRRNQLLISIALIAVILVALVVGNSWIGRNPRQAQNPPEDSQQKLDQQPEQPREVVPPVDPDADPPTDPPTDGPDDAPPTADNASGQDPESNPDTPLNGGNTNPSLPPEDNGTLGDEPLEGLGNPQENASFEDVMQDIFGSDEVTSDFDDPELRTLQLGNNDPIDDVLRKLATEQPLRSRSARVMRPVPRQVDVQRSLTMQVAGFRNPQMRVPQLMAVAESLTSVPVWIDIERYQGQPLSLDQKNPVEAVQVTIPDLLTEQLEKFGFAFERYSWNPQQPELQGLRLFPTGSDQREIKTYLLPWAANLTPEQVERDTAIVFRMVYNYVVPGRWETDPTGAAINPDDVAAGLGTIRIADNLIEVAHEPFVHRQIERLLAQLQVANENSDPRLWPDALQPMAIQGGPRLRAVVQVQQYRLTPLNAVFQKIYDQSDLTVLLDWPSLIQEGWTPDTEVPLVANNVLAESALRELCLDMELSMRILAPHVVCLLSDKEEAKVADLEIYPVGDLVANPQAWRLLRGRLGRLLEQEFARYETAYLYYEPRFNCIVARLPQSMHRRLHLYLETARK